MSDFSFISNAHPAFIDSMYEQYHQDPEMVEASWRLFFKGFDFAQSAGNGHAGHAAAADQEQVLNEHPHDSPRSPCIPCYQRLLPHGRSL